MFDRMRGWLMALLRVPHEPTPQAGSRRLQVFRAAPRYYHYKLVLWGLKQLGALAGWVAYLYWLPFRSWTFGGSTVANIFLAIEAVALGAFILQIPLSFAIVKLDFELRWYLLSDRSLRIREGIVSLREKTMTFANVQQISIRQNPLQRLLGIADVQVRSAGGGGTTEGKGKSLGESMHEAWFRGVAEPERIREVIQDRVRTFADSGLGDPDEARRLPASNHRAAAAAARELYDEVRLLRLGISGRGSPAPASPTPLPPG